MWVHIFSKEPWPYWAKIFTIGPPVADFVPDVGRVRSCVSEFQKAIAQNPMLQF